MRLVTLAILLSLLFSEVRYFFFYLLNSLDAVILITIFLLAWRYYY